MSFFKHSRLSRILSAVIITEMIVIGGIIAPLHHHDDGKTHDDCQLCLVSHQPAADSPLVQFTLPVASIVDYHPILQLLIRQYAQSFFSSRAPPSLLCSIS
ncbi:MAG TPA: hypothetical protein VKF42_07570 [Chitinivibrionales bacterium]|jgi:hypothetical protein|nr:hypothetical protein [Chitinivibrionales bacterium]